MSFLHKCDKCGSVYERRLYNATLSVSSLVSINGLFSEDNGLRQFDACSPACFSVLLEKTLKEVKAFGGLP